MQVCLIIRIMKIKKIVKSLFYLLITFFISSCYYDIEEELYPQNATKCDTTGTTLSKKIKPIISKNCYTCHSAANSANMGSGIDLETYTELKKYVDNSKLLMSVKHSSGVSAMPKGTTNKIPVCDITLIEYWITKGAKND